ncbi:retrovirus-related pol polyprotein from transposon TNT 1-94 [Tanacetum coccineum]
MTGNKAYLSDYEDFNGGFVAFGSDPKGGKITGKGKIKTANLDFDDVYFVDELNFKLLDESQVVLRAPRKDDVYSLDLKNIVPFGGIKREFSVARTPQQNGVSKRKNRTLIEAARTMLVDSLLPIPFRAEAVYTACYVLISVLVTKPQNKTPYELLIGKFDGKSNEGYLFGYSTTSKAFRVFNKRTKSVENQVNVDVELAAKAMDDVSRQAFEEEKRRIASQKKATQATSTNKLSTNRCRVADLNKVDNTIAVSPFPTLRFIRIIRLTEQILGDPIHQQTNHKDYQNCLFACFLSQEEPKTISQALQDESCVEAMQEELLQFKLQKVCVLVDLPYGKKEEGIDYDEVFAPVARIKVIRLFLAFASYIGFTVYQMDVKSAFIYGTIEEVVYVHQPPGFVDPAHPNKVYKVIKALYGLHQAPRAWTAYSYRVYKPWSRLKNGVDVDVLV